MAPLDLFYIRPVSVGRGTACLHACMDAATTMAFKPRSQSLDSYRFTFESFIDGDSHIEPDVSEPCSDPLNILKAD